MATAPTKRLCDCPITLHPDPASEHAVYEAKVRTRELGVTFRPFITYWVHAPDMRTMGMTVTRRSGEIAVFLRDDLGPFETYRTMLHELIHVSDAAILGSLGELAEERADRFMYRACQWPPVSRAAGDAQRDALLAEGRRLCDEADQDRRRLTSRERHLAAKILFELDVLRARRCASCRAYDCGAAACFARQLAPHARAAASKMRGRV